MVKSPLVAGLVLSLLTAGSWAKAPTGTPTLQPGQSIVDFIQQNPNLQRTWITSEDRKKAAAQKFVSTCATTGANCAQASSLDVKNNAASFRERWKLNHKQPTTGGGK